MSEPLSLGFSLPLTLSSLAPPLTPSWPSTSQALSMCPRSPRRALNLCVWLFVAARHATPALGCVHSPMSTLTQMRGSIPLVWGHGEQKHMVPRPDIHLQELDPTYESTLRHLDEVWKRYGHGPVIVFDLIRQVRRSAAPCSARAPCECAHAARLRGGRLVWRSSFGSDTCLMRRLQGRWAWERGQGG